MTHNPRTDTCESCVFFALLKDAKEWGVCRRHVPRFDSEASGYEGRFPRTFYTNWCGEFQSRERVEKLARSLAFGGHADLQDMEDTISSQDQALRDKNEHIGELNAEIYKLRQGGAR